MKPYEQAVALAIGLPTDKLSPAESAVLEAIVLPPMRGPEIARESGYDYETIKHTLPPLVRAGLLEKVKGGYKRT